MKKQQNETTLQLIVKELKENCAVVFSYERQE